MTDQTETIEISDWSKLPTNPLVSVYMLAYRHEKFIAQAIESVIAQQCDFPIELIVGEDCSPDRTREIVLNYQRRHPHLVRILTAKENVGSRANSHRCWSATRGKYVAICEGDDYWCDPTKLARQMEVFRIYPECSLVFHAAAYVDSQSGRQTRTSRQSLFSRMLSTNEVILGDGGLIPTASILVRREIALNPPFWYHRAPVGDYPLALHAALRGKIAYLDRIMSVYNINVPHSWTQRYVPDVGSRMLYARQIEEMFAGFSAESEHRFDKATREMISKYYSDPLVRLPCPIEERRRFHLDIADKLQGSDRLLAWLAAKYDLKLPLLKDVARKSRSLRRLIMSHALCERITVRHKPIVHHARDH
ncbi:glycosyltransferase [Dyella acidisoli]|nr:glycosyltransferase [Dyella acidisoli]